MKRSIRLGSFLILIFLLFVLVNMRPQTAFMQSESPLRKTAVSPTTSQTVNPQSNTAVTVNVQSTNELIPDGSFEERPSLWREQSSVPECPVLIAEWEPITENPAYDGTSYSWGGGSCLVDNVGIPRDTMVSQMITIPVDAPALSFRYWSERLDDDTFEDFAYIYLNNVNTPVWFYPLTQANNTNGWVEETLDLSDFAGQTVQLIFSVEHGTSSAVGNLYIDFIEFAEPAAQTWEVTPVNGGGFSYTTASGKPIGDFLIPPEAVDKDTTIYFKSATSPGFPLYPVDESPLGAGLTFAGTAFDLEAFNEFIYLPFITNNGRSTLTNQTTQILGVESPTVSEDVNSFQFSKPIKVRIHYDEAKLEELGIEENQIYLYYWTGDGWLDAAKTCDEPDWIDPSGYVRNFTDNWFELHVCHFSRFGTVG